MSNLLHYQNPAAFAIDPPPVKITVIFTGTTIYGFQVGNGQLQPIHEVRWDMGNGVILNNYNNNFSYTYSDAFIEPAEKTIICTIQPVRHVNRKVNYIGFNGSNNSTLISKIKSIKVENLNTLNNININYTKTEEIDIRSITNLYGNIYLSSNTKLGSILFPSAITATNDITSFSISW